MELNQQVVSLELAKKLKELGVKQDCLYFWQNCHECNEQVNEIEWEITDSPWEHPRSEIYAAFTVAELFELMPLINGCPLQLIKGATLTKGILYCARYDSLNMHFSTL